MATVPFGPDVRMAQRRGYRKQPADRRRRHKRPSGTKFVPEILPSDTPGNIMTEQERRIRALFDQLGMTYNCEDVSLRYVKNGRDNGRHGLVRFDFRVEGVFVEATETGSDKKAHAIEFVRRCYGFVVVLITGDMLPRLEEDPEQLRTIILAAKAEQAVLRAGKSDAQVLAAAAETRRIRAARRREVLTEQKKRQAPAYPSGVPMTYRPGGFAMTPQMLASASQARLNLRTA